MRRLIRGVGLVLGAAIGYQFADAGRMIFARPQSLDRNGAPW